MEGYCIFWWHSSCIPAVNRSQYNQDPILWNIKRCSLNSVLDWFHKSWWIFHRVGIRRKRSQDLYLRSKRYYQKSVLRPDLSIVDHLLRGLTLSIYSDTFIYITYQLHLKLSKSDIFIFVFSCFHIILPVLILVVSHTIKYTFEKAADNCSKGSKGLSGKYECCKIPAMLQHEKKENFSQNQQEKLHKQSETFQDQKDFFFLG